MPVLNFKEIPEAHKATGEQDSFELFARDFLKMSGFKVVSPPGRGADGGKDMIVEEIRRGIAGETVVRWLVSCKHKAHSSRSVGVEDETNILERIRSKQCHGFIGFYSTLPSSSLITRLEELSESEHMFHDFYDYGRIERELLASQDGIKLAERFFPISLSSWKRNNPAPVQIFADAEGLKCENCGADLIAKGHHKAIVTQWKKYDFSIPDKTLMHVVDMYWCCKGECDDRLRNEYRHMYPGYGDTWQDISDICIPTVYLNWALSVIVSLHRGNKYTDEAIQKRIKFLSELFPYVVRDLTDEEEEDLRSLMSIPSELGGLGT